MDRNKNLNLQLKAKTDDCALTAIKMVQPSPNNSNSKTNDNEAQVRTLNFMQSFRPVYYVSRVFGLKPFSIIYDSNGAVQQSKITKFDGLWFVISMCIYVMMAFSVEESTDGKFIFLLGNVFTIFGLACSVLTIIFDMYNRSRFIDILKNISIFDKEVSNLNGLLNSSSTEFLLFRIYFSVFFRLPI